MKLKTLEEHNTHQRAKWFEAIGGQEPTNNGIACPTCGEELHDSNRNEVLTSNPPQYNVHCRECGWRGYRII